MNHFEKKIRNKQLYSIIQSESIENYCFVISILLIAYQIVKKVNRKY